MAIGEYLRRQQQMATLLTPRSLPPQLPSLTQVYYVGKQDEGLLPLQGIQKSYQPIHVIPNTRPFKSLPTPGSILEHPALDRLCKKIKALDVAIEQCAEKDKQRHIKTIKLVIFAYLLYHI